MEFGEVAYRSHIPWCGNFSGCHDGVNILYILLVDPGIYFVMTRNILDNSLRTGFLMTHSPSLQIVGGDFK